MRTAREVRADLEQFEPGANEVNSVSRLYEILEGADTLANRDDIVPALFGVLERFPNADLGNPGPIVHALESIAPFSKELAVSLMRQPTWLTINMVARILNSNVALSDRTFWLAQLKKVEGHVRCSAANRAFASDILGRYAA